MDNFYEQFLTKDYGKLQKKFETTRNTLVVLAMIAAVIVGLFGVIAFIAGYIILGLIARAMFLEYEYELTENELVITKIMNKKKRKIITTLDIKNIVNVKGVEEGNQNGAKLVKACVDESGLREQIIFVQKNSQLIGFKVAMDKKLISMCKRINPLNFSGI